MWDTYFPIIRVVDRAYTQKSREVTPEVELFLGRANILARPPRAKIIALPSVVC